jgi:integrase
MENILPNNEDIAKKEESWKHLRKDFKDFLALKELADSSIEAYMIRFNIFPHDQLSQETVDNFLREHKDSNARSFLRHYLKFLKRHDIELPERTGRKKQRIARRIDAQDLVIVKDALHQIDTKYGLIFELTLEGGLRRAEALGLTPSSFEWDEWAKDKSKPCRLRIIGKGNKERIVIISSKLAQKVRDYIMPTLNKGSLSMSGNIFTMTTKTWWETLKDTSLSLFGKRIKPHDLRRSRATYLYEEGGFDILELQQFLGHADLSTTQIYLNPDREKILKKFESYVEKMEKIEDRKNDV